MENPELHDAASKLAHSKSSWVPFTTPGVSAAARALAMERNDHSGSRRASSAKSRSSSARSHSRVKAKSASRSRMSSHKRSRSSR